MTKVINLFAGPGSGKSSIAAGLYSKMKFAMMDCELVTEYAKELVWEKRLHEVDQTSILKEQVRRVERLVGNVEYVVTDSPILLSVIYGRMNDMGSEFEKLVLDTNNRFDNRNYLIKRVKPYVPKGRTQTEEEAKGLDFKIQMMLEENLIKYDRIFGDIAIDYIFNDLKCV